MAREWILQLIVELHDRWYPIVLGGQKAEQAGKQREGRLRNSYYLRMLPIICRALRNNRQESKC